MTAITNEEEFQSPSEIVPTSDSLSSSLLSLSLTSGVAGEARLQEKHHARQVGLRGYGNQINLSYQGGHGNRRR